MTHCIEFWKPVFVLKLSEHARLHAGLALEGSIYLPGRTAFLSNLFASRRKMVLCNWLPLHYAPNTCKTVAPCSLLWWKSRRQTSGRRKCLLNFSDFPELSFQMPRSCAIRQSTRKTKHTVHASCITVLSVALSIVAVVFGQWPASWRQTPHGVSCSVCLSSLRQWYVPVLHTELSDRVRIALLENRIPAPEISNTGRVGEVAPSDQELSSVLTPGVSHRWDVVHRWQNCPERSTRKHFLKWSEDRRLVSDAQMSRAWGLAGSHRKLVETCRSSPICQLDSQTDDAEATCVKTTWWTVCVCVCVCVCVLDVRVSNSKNLAQLHTTRSKHWHPRSTSELGCLRVAPLLRVWICTVPKPTPPRGDQDNVDGFEAWASCEAFYECVVSQSSQRKGHQEKEGTRRCTCTRENSTKGGGLSANHSVCLSGWQTPHPTPASQLAKSPQKYLAGNDQHQKRTESFWWHCQLTYLARGRQVTQTIFSSDFVHFPAWVTSPPPL